MSKKPTKQKHDPIFKHVVKRKQKRKDGKRVYYYVNKTDGGIVSKEAYQRNETIKKKYKQVYGKNWKEIFKDTVKDVKKEEKRSDKKDLQDSRDNIQKYLDKNGFPRYFSSFINQSVVSEFTDAVLEGRNVVIEFNHRFYLLTDMDLFDFQGFFNELMGWFFEKVRELYNMKKRSNSSPFLITPWILYSGAKSPRVEGTNLNEITANEDFSLNYGRTKIQKNKTLLSKIRSEFKNYFSGLKEIDLITYILKLQRQ